MAKCLVLTLEATGETRQLESGILKLGRGKNADWVVKGSTAGPPVSRLHCQFDMGPRGATVTDLDSTNGTIVNGRPLVPNVAEVLRGGEVLEIGIHRLVVDLVNGSAQKPELPELGLPLSAPTPRQPPVAFVDRADTPQPLPARPMKGMKDPLAGGYQAAPPDLLNSRYDGTVGRSVNTVGPQFEAMPPRRPLPLDARTAGRGDAAPAFNEGPFGSFEKGGDPLSPRNAPKAQPTPPTNDDPDPRTIPEPARAAPIERVKAPPPKPAAPADGTGASLLAAFLEAAGQPAGAADGQDPEAFFRDAGQVFARMADGVRELLAVRAVIKDHAGLDHTQISAALNNPLKLAINATEATAALLGKGEPGYLSPVVAVESSFRDLKAHEMAILTGVQSAVDEMLALFNPAMLERKLDGAGTLATLLQGGRRARLWELYQERYEDISQSARMRFMGRLDATFRTAYARKAAEVSASEENQKIRSGRKARL